MKKSTKNKFPKQTMKERIDAMWNNIVKDTKMFENFEKTASKEQLEKYYQQLEQYGYKKEHN